MNYEINNYMIIQNTALQKHHYNTEYVVYALVISPGKAE